MPGVENPYVSRPQTSHDGRRSWRVPQAFPKLSEKGPPGSFLMGLSHENPSLGHIKALYCPVHAFRACLRKSAPLAVTTANAVRRRTTGAPRRPRRPRWAGGPPQRCPVGSCPGSRERHAVVFVALPVRLRRRPLRGAHHDHDHPLPRPAPRSLPDGAGHPAGPPRCDGRVSSWPCCRPAGVLQEWARDPRIPGQAAARSRLDVRRRGGTVRPDQRRAVPRPGPAMAQGGRQGGRRAPRAEDPRPRGGHRHLLAALRPHRRLRRPVRLLPGDAPGRQAAAALAAVHRRRRDEAPVQGRHLRRRHHLLRAAQRAGHGRRPARDAPGDPARRADRDLRVLAPDLGAVG